ncbi:hypothetical protein DV738_g906, partial [Chaetothyriales sp. CBS 135597]
MSVNPATELASAIQSVSIKQNPSPEHDVNPSTAASKREPVDLVSPALSDIDETDADELDVDEEEEEELIPSYILKPRRRRKSFPKLPDFRFEQSYLASIKNAKSNTDVVLITLRDQVLLPLAQGVLWNLVMFGWRYSNRASKFSGQSVGAKVRKWWWGLNNWKLPTDATQGTRPASPEGASLLNRWQRDVKRWTRG